LEYSLAASRSSLISGKHSESFFRYINIIEKNGNDILLQILQRVSPDPSVRLAQNVIFITI